MKSRSECPYFWSFTVLHPRSQEPVASPCGPHITAFHSSLTSLETLTFEPRSVVDWEFGIRTAWPFHRPPRYSRSQVTSDTTVVPTRDGGVLALQFCSVCLQAWHGMALWMLDEILQHITALHLKMKISGWTFPLVWICLFTTVL
jgi:hypothetical protein